MLNEYFCVLGLMSSVEERVVWKAVYFLFPRARVAIGKDSDAGRDWGKRKRG